MSFIRTASVSGVDTKVPWDIDLRPTVNALDICTIVSRPESVSTIAQIEEFLSGSGQIEFTPSGGELERYAHISRVLS